MYHNIETLLGPYCSTACRTFSTGTKVKKNKSYYTSKVLIGTVYHPSDQTGLPTTATQCCTVLQPAVIRFCSECKTTQRGSFSRLQDDLMPSQPLGILRQLRWLPPQNRVQCSCVDLQESQQRHSTDIPQSSLFTSRLESVNGHFARLRSYYIYILDKPFTMTDFARRVFRCSAPTVWNSLPQTIISADSLSS